MKRSESMLVYGVTAILLVIVGVAVIFGDGQEVQGNGSTSTLDNFIELNTDDGQPGRDLFVDSDRVPGPDVEDPETDLEKQGTVIDPEPEVETAPVITAVHLANFARYEVYTPFGDVPYRRVDMPAGRTFEEICEVFAPGHDPQEILRNNESLDLKSIAPGTKVLLPLVPDEELVARANERKSIAPIRSNSGGRGAVAPGPTPVGGEAALGSHVVTSGESLWGIAKGVVGTGRATAYAEKIRLENNLPNNTIRPGMTLRLPPSGR